MTRIRRKKNPHNIRDVKRASRTRARTKDLDQIQEDIAKKGTGSTDAAAPELDPDLPGLGQFYCIHCAKYFVSQPAMDVHLASKPHKKRVKVLQEPAYTQRDAEAAVGLRTDNTRGRRVATSEMNVDSVVHEGIFANLASA
ncbi:UNVERIFIED_CONTAM: Bud site selection protein 20 [Siphonaria sp. JEL0065]|nr:Bud site selection protein 20 [Siphonaria sp. JEL0065]